MRPSFIVGALMVSLAMAFPFFIASIFGAVLLFGAWMLHLQFVRADALLEGWARRSGYRIVHKASANVGDGPGSTRQASKQVKFRVVVEDEGGAHKSGVVCVGSRAMGTLSDEVTVQWDG